MLNFTKVQYKLQYTTTFPVGGGDAKKKNILEFQNTSFH